MPCKSTETPPTIRLRHNIPSFPANNLLSTRSSAQTTDAAAERSSDALRADAVALPAYGARVSKLMACRVHCAVGVCAA